ncbi:MAG: sigma-70 family RNA polymerase sigma factor [Planctomycetota bacterium]
MSPNPSARPDAGELLAHASWLRALARSLVRDPASADDLVQDTWATALASPPSDERPLGPWLARVLRNRARQRARGESRRALREASASRAEELPSPEELLERMELQRELVDGVLALDEPYREALILRYYEGLTAAEIAARRDTSAATVRSHLLRGRERLRELLDRRPGGREAWVALLAPRPANAPAAEGALGAGLPAMVAMNTVLKAGAAALVAVVAVVGLRALGARGAPVRPQGSPAGSADAELLATQARGESERRLASGSVAAITAGVSSGPTAAADGPGVASAPRQRLAARAIDEALRPIAGAVLSLYSAKSEPSGADGRVELALSAAHTHDGGYLVALQASGYGTIFEHVQLESDEPLLDLGDLVLAPGGTLAGRVLGPDGAPLAGAEVVIGGEDHLRHSPDDLARMGPEPYGWSPRTRTDADGRFRLDGVEAGERVLWAGARGRYWTWLADLDVPVGEAIDVGDLRLTALRREDRITGRVVDPTGEPLAGYRFWVSCQAPYGPRMDYGFTDAEGRFVVAVIADATHDLRVEDLNERWSDAFLPGVMPGTEGVELAFRDTRELRFDVRLRGAEAPLAFRLAALSEVGDEPIAEALGEAGTATLREPDERFRLRVGADGARQVVLGPFGPGELAAVTAVELERAPGITGRVTAGGVGLAGAELRLYREPAPGMLIHVRGFRSRTPFNPELTGRSDADGRFLLTPQEAGDYVLRVDRDGYAAGEVDLAGFDPAVGAAELVVELDAGGSVEGLVRTPAGVDPAGLVVAASRLDPYPRPTRVGADGRYRLDGLTAGPWTVELLRSDPLQQDFRSTHHLVDELPPALRPNVDVRAGDVARRDFDLADLPRSGVEGTLTVDDAPAAGWRVELRIAGFHTGRDEDLPRAEVGADGRYRIEIGREGPHELVFRHPDVTLGVSALVELELRDGTLSYDLAFRTGALAGEVGSGDPTAYLFPFAAWDGPGGVEVAAQLALGPDGRFRAPFVPAGRVEIRNHVPVEGRRARREAVADVEVVAGGEAFVKLP